MRNVREVYKKLREVKFKYLVKLYKRYTRKIPENCKYSYSYKINDKTEILLCLLHQPNLDLNSGIFPHLIEVCQDPKQCNGFIFKYTKENIKEVFEEDIKLRKHLYPEISVLEWVLDKDKENKITILQKIFNSFRGRL